MKEIALTILSYLIQGLAVLLAPIVIYAALGWARGLWLRIRFTYPATANILTIVAEIAVKAAEQMHLADPIVKKKEVALEIAQKLLEAEGWHIDLKLIDASIESAVWEFFNKDNPAKVGGITPQPPSGGPLPGEGGA